MSGYHLILDGWTDRTLTCNELTNFISLIASPQHGIDMTIIVGPEATQCEGHFSVWAIIAESHIILAVHDTGMVLLDVFSCKKFESAIVVALAKQQIGLRDYFERTLARAGTSW